MVTVTDVTPQFCAGLLNFFIYESTYLSSELPEPNDQDAQSPPMTSASGYHRPFACRAAIIRFRIFSGFSVYHVPVVVAPVVVAVAVTAVVVCVAGLGVGVAVLGFGVGVGVATAIVSVGSGVAVSCTVGSTTTGPMAVSSKRFTYAPSLVRTY